MKELDLEFEAMMLDAMIVGVPAIQKLVLARDSLTDEMIDKAKNAIVNACTLATTEPGSVIRISCDTASELVFCSKVLTELLPMLKDVDLLEESTSTKFELSNNSAIMLSRKFKDEG